MTSGKPIYKTRQRTSVSTFLAENTERYLSVDDVWAGMLSQDIKIGRSTVYRCLQAMVAKGEVLKATAPSGEARYRLREDAASAQLVCLECGRALPLDCHMVSAFSTHVLEHHGFRIDAAHTALYGLCAACRGVTR